MTPPWERCRKYLAKYMYSDKVTVTRQVAAVDKDGADTYELQDVYKDVPCKLSQYGKELQSGQEARAFTMSNDLRLCVDPDIKILPNDILTITHEGDQFQLNAAKPFPYPDHVEISVRRKEEA